VSVVLREVVLPLAHYTLEVSVEFSARTTALYGPSGSGKTSVLELIAGLRVPQSGTIALHGRDVTHTPPRLRRVGYVPQDDALFPHMTVRQNISYGARDEDSTVVDVLEIAPLLDRGVDKLSGGERKRVALARALLTRPDVLLLDEPLSGVDVALRDRVLEYLQRVLAELPIPTIYVTHQREEVQAICEAVVTLDRGRVVGSDPYDRQT
jgi:molybdate transport system ATP-binding protein